MRVVALGEIMLRLAPEGYLRFLQEPRFQATFGGGEANVAVSLCNFGNEAVFVTKLPDNDIANAAIRELKGFGVETTFIARGGERMGIYYLEKGASVRASKVVYDRAHSAFAEACAEDFDWDSILEGAQWLHFTGITPALGDNVADITENALKVAKNRGLTVSCDLNYRKKLWSNDRAREVMGGLMKYVDVCICNEQDAADVFGISAKGSDVEGGILNTEGYRQVAKQLADKFGFKCVAITLRESVSASDNNWSAMLYADGKAEFSRKYALRIVDRVGGGDSFGAGLIHALGKGFDKKSALEFAVAASALKHTVEGDYNRVSVAEVEALVANGGSGRVQR